MALYCENGAYLFQRSTCTSHELYGINDGIGEDLSQDRAVSETSNEGDVNQSYYLERHNFPTKYGKYNAFLSFPLPLSYSTKQLPPFNINEIKYVALYNETKKNTTIE